MYGSFRFFIDRVPALDNNRNLIKIFELFSRELNVTYDYISYMIFDPEKDGMIVNRKYNYNDFGIGQFCNTQILPIYKGKNGDVSAPIITATCECPPLVLYEKIRVVILFPAHLIPFEIKVDFEITPEFEKPDMQKYAMMVQTLNHWGYHVNNSLFHVYGKKKLCHYTGRRSDWNFN